MLIVANLRDFLLRLSFNRVWQDLLLGLLGVTLAFLLLNIGLSWQWLDQPFAGFLHLNRVVTESNLTSRSTTEAPIGQVKLAEGDVILSVNDQVVTSSAQLNDYLRQQVIGQPMTYRLRNPAGQAVETKLAVARFTSQDFMELVIIPAFIASLALMVAAVAVYNRVDLIQTKLFVLGMLALVYALASMPEFTLAQLFPLNFIGMMAGKIALPSLLLHFLLVFPHPRKIVKNWPFLLPLIYLPVLPGLVFLPALLKQPETMHPVNNLIGGYTLIYTVAGAGLLVEATLRADRSTTRKQVAVLLGGLIFPTFFALVLHFIMENQQVNLTVIAEILQKYGLIGLPIAATIAVLRYQMFDLKRSNRLHVLFTGAAAGALIAYFLLVVLINPFTVRLNYLRLSDVRIIAGTVMLFFVLRPLYSLIRQRLERRLYGSVEDFRIGLRLFQQGLLKAKSRHDLEALVSWDMPDDFRLRSAELTPRSRPSSPYSLQLPLYVNNVSLGTLFLGAKINGKDFTAREKLILLELQQQLALAVWSLELDEAIRTTEELTRLKSKFLTHVTHELRTPLNGIINYIGFVVDGDTGPLNPEQTDHLNQALQAAEKLLHLINNILDLSKIEAGQMILQLQPVNLTELIAETVPNVAEVLGGKPVQMLTNLAPGLPPVPADRLRLRQIILSLLSNAAKFTDVGAVCLKAYPENGQVIIQVSDTGRGISPELLPAIFQQFTGEGLTDRDEHSGAGLSLPITKSLVELHGGHIQVESQAGQGTTFTVTLPVEHKT